MMIIIMPQEVVVVVVYLAASFLQGEVEVHNRALLPKDAYLEEEEQMDAYQQKKALYQYQAEELAWVLRQTWCVVSSTLVHSVFSVLQVTFLLEFHAFHPSPSL